MENQYKFNLPPDPEVSEFSVKVDGGKCIVPSHLAANEEFMRRFVEDFLRPPKPPTIADLTKCEVVFIHITKDGHTVHSSNNH